MSAAENSMNMQQSKENMADDVSADISVSTQPKQATSTFGSRTDVGYVREHNEDSLLVAPPLYVVCDGMGGHEAGEVASEIAIGTIASQASRIVDVESLGQAVEEANLRIIQAAADGLGKEGMGTTCTAAMVLGERLFIAQVGDSRAYLLHEGNLQQLTRDHSVVADLVEAGEISREQARTHKWRSYITRALGLDPYVQPDLYELNVGSGDRLMLCSDGLYSMVDDANMKQILCENPDPQQCADALVERALAHGGTDNITAVVTDIAGYSAERNRKFARRAKVTAAIIVALMVVLIGGMAALFGFWVNNSAYLDNVDGKVAIHKGVPGDFLGIEFAQLEEVTDVNVADLQPGTAQRLSEEGIRCDSVEAARSLVQEYKEDIAKKE